MNKRIKKKQTKATLEEQVRALLKSRRDFIISQARLTNAISEINSAVDAILIAIAKQYGEKVVEGEEVLGYRLVIDPPATDENFEVKTTKDVITGKYTIGVIKK